MASEEPNVSYEHGSNDQEKRVFHRDQFFTTEPPQLKEDARELLEKYSGIPPDEVVSHVMSVVRDFLADASTRS